MKKKFVIPLLFVALVTTAFSIVHFSSNARAWMKEQIENDLSSYTKEDLNPIRLQSYFSHADPNNKLVHIQVKNNQIYFEGKISGAGEDRAQSVCAMLKSASKYRRLPDVDLILTVHDGVIQAPKSKNVNHFLPIFCFAKRDRELGVLIPDPLTYAFAKKSCKNISRSKLKKRNWWGQKKEVAFWRGGTSGGEYTDTNWYQKSRSLLSLLSLHHPNEIDAGFSAYHSMPSHLENKIQELLPKKKWVSHKKHLKYKYLVIADGNTCTYPRYYLALYSGSAVFKDSTDHIQWFYRALKPGRHFVALEKDFSDLPEKVLWARSHDSQMRSMAKQSQRFVKHNLMTCHINEYIYRLLSKYALLQDQSVEIGHSMNLYEG